jgi:dihydroorotate dehydrogenase electron transfer subunit
MLDRSSTHLLTAVDAQVVANSPLCREHVAIEVALREFPASEPGQFIQLQCGEPISGAPQVIEWPTDGFPSLDGREWRENPAFLRRPFSIADRWEDTDGGSHLLVISRTVGRGTRWLEQLRIGDRLNLSGPLGRGFRVPEPPTSAGAEAMPSIVLIGGGVGIPPLLYTARRLHELGWRDVTAVFGATTRDLLPLHLLAEPNADGTPSVCVALPGEAAYPAIITTDDGSAGCRGLVTDGLSAWHARHSASAPPLVLACGPERMVRAVAEATRKLNLDCQLCIERSMGCGLGTCLSCVVRLRDGGRPEGWRWGLACLDGPVFSRDELLDYHSSPCT